MSRKTHLPFRNHLHGVTLAGMSRPTKAKAGRFNGTTTMRCFLAALVALVASVAPLNAAETPRSIADEKVSLIVADTGRDAAAIIGLRMVLKPGWHTYWRTPGDSGLAPTFDWSASKNVKVLELLWPVPTRFDAEGDTTFGYADEVIWPVFVRAVDPEKPVVLELKMFYGVCKDICVSNEVHISQTFVPASPGRASFEGDDGTRVRYFLERVPHGAQAPVTVSAKLAGEELRITLSNASEVPALIPEGPRGIWFGKPEVSQSGKDVIYKMPVEIEKGFGLKGSNIVLTFSGPNTAIEERVRVE